MKIFNRGSQIGISIFTIAFIIMIVLLVLGKPVPNLVRWLFFGGVILTIVSSFVSKIKR